MAEPLFKACTRPAMLFSVPMKPFLASSGAIVLVGMWANYLGAGMWGLLLLLPNYLVMRGISHFDDGMFGLLWLRLLCRQRDRTRRVYGGDTVYSPLRFTSRSTRP